MGKHGLKCSQTRVAVVFKLVLVLAAYRVAESFVILSMAAVNQQILILEVQFEIWNFIYNLDVFVFEAVIILGVVTGRLRCQLKQLLQS